MFQDLLDPVVLFFVLGFLAGMLKAPLRLPEAIYEILSIYLLVAIGLRGGVELAESHAGSLFLPAVGAIALGVLLPLIAYPVLRHVGKLSAADSAAIAAHYGSVSAVTFAVALTYLDRQNLPYEDYVTVLLVLMEIPAIAIGILIARLRTSSGPVRYSKLLHEVFLGKSVYLLIGGLLVGYLLGPERIEPVKIVFVDLFKGALAFFLLEMGLVASHRISDLKTVGAFLFGFGIGMPIFSGILGAFTGLICGLSVGGSVVLSTLAASASYIAAPAAMRIAVPEANPTLYVTAALGITFPFNLIAGIPLYFWISNIIHSFFG